jgi:type IV secretion system protein VirB11
LNEKTSNAFQFFKNHYLRALNQKRSINLQDLLPLVIEEFDLQRNEDQQFLIDWYQNVSQLTYLYEYLNDEKLQEIILHGPKDLECNLGRERSFHEINLNPKDYQLSLESLAAQYGINWSHAKPFASFPIQLRGASYRATLIHPSLGSQDIAKLFLRTSLPLQSLADLRYPDEVLPMLKEAIINKKNILISGATSSGKTTLMRGMLSQIPIEDHLLLLEDTPEIQQIKSRVTHLIADEDHAEKTLLHYCKYAMRLRPDRIVLGEMRGAEVISFLLCLNTGHKGMMTTLHANNAREAINRVAQLFLLYHDRESLKLEYLISMVCQNIDWVIHMEKGEIQEIISVRGAENGFIYAESLYNCENLAA